MITLSHSEKVNGYGLDSGCGYGYGFNIYESGGFGFIRAFCSTFCYYKPYNASNYSTIILGTGIYNINGSGNDDGKGCGFGSNHNYYGISTIGYDAISSHHRIKPIEAELDEAHE